MRNTGRQGGHMGTSAAKSSFCFLLLDKCDHKKTCNPADMYAVRFKI